jgi:hypothetical protein
LDHGGGALGLEGEDARVEFRVGEVMHVVDGPGHVHFGALGIAGESAGDGDALRPAVWGLGGVSGDGVGAGAVGEPLLEDVAEGITGETVEVLAEFGRRGGGGCVEGLVGHVAALSARRLLRQMGAYQCHRTLRKKIEMGLDRMREAVKIILRGGDFPGL